MKKTLIITILIAIMLVAPIYAQLTADAKIIENNIYPDEQAKFTLTITNKANVAKFVKIYSTDVEWYVEQDPFITKINPNETVQTQLKLIPNAWTESGAQSVNVFIDSYNTDESISLGFPVYVKSFSQEKKEYSPSVEMKVTFPEEWDPREPVAIRMYMRNRNRLDITEMKIMVVSALINEERIVQLGPLSETTEVLSFDLDLLTEPQEGQVEFIMLVNNKTINKERATYKVISYSNLETKEDVFDELFKKTIDYTIVNEGNVKSDEKFTVQTTLLKSIFTRANPKPTKIELTKQPYYEWDMQLNPMEQAKIEFIVNYRPIIYVILIIVVLIMVYFLYRSPVLLKKEAIVIGSSQDGISEMKVLLHIRNRSQDLIERIKITDFIPSIADLVKEEHVGSLAPTKIIRHQQRGTIIKWELEALEPFEERIISYRLSSKMAIVGGLTLPPAKVKFDTSKGKERTIKSNKGLVSMGL